MTTIFMARFPPRPGGRRMSKAVQTDACDDRSDRGEDASRARGWAPRLLPTLGMVAGWRCALSLGNWQRDRARGEGVGERLAASRMAAPAAHAPRRRRRSVGGPALPAACGLEGRFVPAGQIFIDNRVHGGRAGFHVLTPLAAEGGRPRRPGEPRLDRAGARARRRPTCPAPGEQARRGARDHPADTASSSSRGTPSPAPCGRTSRSTRSPGRQGATCCRCVVQATAGDAAGRARQSPTRASRSTAVFAHLVLPRRDRVRPVGGPEPEERTRLHRGSAPQRTPEAHRDHGRSSPADRGSLVTLPLLPPRGDGPTTVSSCRRRRSPTAQFTRIGGGSLPARRSCAESGCWSPRLGRLPASCVAKLTLMRQVRLMVGRNAGRIERVFVADRTTMALPGAPSASPSTGSRHHRAHRDRASRSRP